MIQETLKKLGFSDKEADIYLSILKNGKIIPTDLAHITKINRSTVYSIISELKKKGVIGEDLSSPIKYVVARPPEDLENIIKKEEGKINKKKAIIANAIQELKNISSNTKYSVPKVRFIAEEELENFLYKQTPIWDKSVIENKTKWLGYQDHAFIEHYKKWIDWYWSRAPKKIDLRLLSNKSEIEKVMEKQKITGRNIKIFKKNIPFTATYWVCGDYIVMIMTNERPHYAIEIRNTELAKNQREIFNALWNVS